MARTSKTPRYDEFNVFENCFGSHQKTDRKWQDYLDAKKPIIVELGCGKAEVSLELARQNPDKNYIGVDLKSDRMWRAATTANEEGLKNIAFIQTDIRKLEEFFAEGEIDEAWITFPDPFPRKRQSKHRMTGPSFIELYRKLLKPGAKINFKTDDPALFQWSLEQFVKAKLTFEDLSFDVYDQDGREDVKIQTTFEKRWLKEGKKVHFVKLRV